jgi:hypothetical protein
LPTVDASDFVSVRADANRENQGRPAVLIDVDGDAVEDAFFFVDTTNGAMPSATDFIL